MVFSSEVFSLIAAIHHRTAVDIASTPLIVKRPRQARGRYVGRHVRLYHLLPGVAQIAHVKTGPTYGYSFAGAAANKIPSQVVTLDRRGKVRRWSFVLYRKLLRATIARRISVFGQHGAQLSRLWRQGPPRARRQAVSALRTAKASKAMSWGLTDPKRFRTVQRSSAFLPIHVVAKVHGVKRGTPFAVAVDGVVQGTGRVAQTTASKDFWVSSVIAPSSLKAPARTRSRSTCSTARRSSASAAKPSPNPSP